MDLGLDEFTDAPPAAQSPPGEGGGGGWTSSGCAAADDCPGGVHGTPTCQQGVCVLLCDHGFADCNDEPGCETATTEDAKNCGGCGLSCSAYCQGGACNDPAEVSLGEVHACAVLMDGSVWCWGANSYGQLGIGQAGGTRYPPMDVGLTNVKGIAAASQHTCALTMDGDLLCWGRGGRVGDGTQMLAAAPVHVASSVASIAAGEGHSCLMTTSGSARCWGRNAFGQLGIGSTVDASAPTAIPNLSGVSRLTCGANHTCARSLGFASTCAITDEDVLLCWGDNSHGQLGDGTTVSRSVPASVVWP